MHKLQQSKARSLRRVQQFLDGQADALGAVNDTPARRQLDAAVLAVGDAGRQQGVRVREMRGGATTQRALERDLRETHLVPMAKFARAHLAQDPGIAALAPTLKNLGGQRLARTAKALVRSAAPFRDIFVAASYPAGFLEEAAAAADALVACIDRRSSHRVERVAATAGIAAALANGRTAIAMLDPVVGRLIAGRAGLVAAWKQAKRITAVPGPARGSSAVEPVTGVVADTPTAKRETTRSRRSKKRQSKRGRARQKNRTA